MIYAEYFRNEDKYTDKDGSELENKAELVWEGQVRMQFDCHRSDLEIVTPAFKSQNMMWDGQYSALIDFRQNSATLVI